jgi:hypothetical protein
MSVWAGFVVHIPLVCLVGSMKIIMNCKKDKNEQTAQNHSSLDVLQRHE